MLVVVDLASISSHYVLQEAIIFCFLLSDKFLVGVHTSYLRFRSHLPRHPPCRHSVELQYVMDGMVSWTMTDVQQGSHFIHLNTTVFPNDTFSLRNCLQCYDFVGFVYSSDTPFLDFPLYLYTCRRGKNAYYAAASHGDGFQWVRYPR
jgi:hypothetical protein